MAISCMVQACVPNDVQEGENPLGLFCPNAETLGAFEKVRAGNLKKFNSADTLSEDLNAVNDLTALRLK